MRAPHPSTSNVPLSMAARADDTGPTHIPALALGGTALPAPAAAPHTATKQRIGYLTSQYPAPSHTFIRREVEALRKRGMEVDTFSVRRPNAAHRLGAADQAETARTFYILPRPIFALLSAVIWGFFRAPGRYFTTFRLAMQHRLPGVVAWAYAIIYFVEAICLARELHRLRIAHLHNHFANPAANVGMLATTYLGLGWSLTLHGISEFDYPAGPLLPEKIKRARFVPCVSSFGRAQAMRIVPAREWSKLMIVRCGLDLDVMPARTLARKPGPLRVVCVGRLSAEKGHHGLLQAFAAVVGRGRDAELRLVGEGPELASLQAEVKRLGLEKRVVFCGQLPEGETLAETAEADLSVSSSFMEGLPVVLMEALALGVAVVAPRVAGVPELVEHDKTGLLFTPADWADLEACLDRALADPELRERLARQGRERVYNEFEVGRASAPIYRRLLAETAGEPG